MTSVGFQQLNINPWSFDSSEKRICRGVVKNNRIFEEIDSWHSTPKDIDGVGSITAFEGTSFLSPEGNPFVPRESFCWISELGEIIE
jgi:hypothetical protein